MHKVALMAVRDTTGLAGLAQALAKAEYGLVATEEASRELRSADLEHEAIALAEASQRLAEADCNVEIVIANFRAPDGGERHHSSAKAALARIDFETVNAIRLAAQKADRVAVFGNPDDYAELVSSLERNPSDPVPIGKKAELAARSLQATSDFDNDVAQLLETRVADRPDLDALSGYPKTFRASWPRSQTFPAGENPHQKAALYGSFFENFEKILGPEIAYESLINLNLAASLIGEFQKPTLAFARNGMAMNAVSGESLEQAFEKLSEQDLTLAKGAALAVNMTLNETLAQSLKGLSCASILAPRFSEEALALLDGASLVTSKEGVGYESLLEIRSVFGGALIQDRDFGSINPMQWQTPTRAQPLVDQWSDLIFAARFIRHARSSACVVAADERVVASSFARLDQQLAWSALEHSADKLKEAVVAFDEPIENGEILESANAKGVQTILHPGHGIVDRDNQLTAKADQLGQVLVMTGASSRKLV